MAEKSGMSRFVQGRNQPVQDGRPESPAAKANADKARMPLPNTGNSAATQSKDGKKKSGRSSAEGKKSQSKSRGQPQAKNAFYDTDTASLAETSTTVSDQQARRPGRSQQQSQQTGGAQAQGHHHHRTEVDEYANLELDDPGEELHDNALEKPNDDREFAERVIAEANASPAARMIVDTYIQGDSYPPTTSGAPSIIENADSRVSDISAHARPGTVHAKPATFAMRGGGQRQLHQRSSAAAAAPAAPQGEQPKQQKKAKSKAHQTHRDVNLESEPFRSEQTEGFAFDKPQTRVQQEQVQLKLTPQVSAPLAQASARHGLVPTGNRRPAQQMLNRGVPNAKAGFDGDVEPNGHDGFGKQVRPASHSTLTLKTEQTDSFGNEQDNAGAEHDGAHRHWDAEYHDQDQDQDQEQALEEIQLDYDYDEIVKKSYAELKNEPFDKAPGAAEPIFADLAEDVDLQRQMETVFDWRDPERQAVFFASLEINAWETAGDWFLDRFGGLVDKLKETRRERREAAREFEDEIEQRDADVRKKRKLTDAALEDMKSSGAAVLAGTPKKTKQRK